MDERIMICLAAAALHWSRHLEGEDQSGNELMDALGLAAAEVSRWRADKAAGPPLRPADLVRFMSRPLAEWLPCDSEECLLVEDGIATWALEWSELRGVDPILEAEQRVILRAMDILSTRADAERRYSELREFLIRQPLVPESRALTMLAPLGLRLSDFYQALGAPCIGHAEGEAVCFPCPRCGWPMIHYPRSGKVRCSADACVREGAQFLWRDGDLEPVGGKRQSAKAVPAMGQVKLTTGLWRYALLPGLWEVELADRLRRLPGVSVALWPSLDLYDLDVTHAGQEWRVDVKDYCSPRRLAKLLGERAPSVSPVHVVIPDSRRADLDVLRRLCGGEGRWRFDTCSSFVMQVRRAVGA